MQFEEFNLHDIYRTPLDQTMGRPTWEPPDIDIIGIYEKPEFLEWYKHIKDHIPDAELRCDYLDLRLQFDAFSEYKSWATDAGLASIACGNREKEKFYEGLIREISEDWAIVCDEYNLVDQKLNPYILGRPPELVEGRPPFNFRDDNGVPRVFGRYKVTGRNQVLPPQGQYSMPSAPSAIPQLPSSVEQQTEMAVTSEIKPAPNLPHESPQPEPQSEEPRACCAII